MWWAISFEIQYRTGPLEYNLSLGAAGEAVRVKGKQTKSLGALLSTPSIAATVESMPVYSKFFQQS